MVVDRHRGARHAFREARDDANCWLSRAAANYDADLPDGKCSRAFDDHARLGPIERLAPTRQGGRDPTATHPRRRPGDVSIVGPLSVGSIQRPRDPWIATPSTACSHWRGSGSRADDEVRLMMDTAGQLTDHATVVDLTGKVAPTDLHPGDASRRIPESRCAACGSCNHEHDTPAIRMTRKVARGYRQAGGVRHRSLTLDPESTLRVSPGEPERWFSAASAPTWSKSPRCAVRAAGGRCRTTARAGGSPGWFGSPCSPRGRTAHAAAGGRCASARPSGSAPCAYSPRTGPATASARDADGTAAPSTTAPSPVRRPPPEMAIGTVAGTQELRIRDQSIR